MSGTHGVILSACYLHYWRLWTSIVHMWTWNIAAYCVFNSIWCLTEPVWNMRLWKTFLWATLLACRKRGSKNRYTSHQSGESTVTQSLIHTSGECRVHLVLLPFLTLNWVANSILQLVVHLCQDCQALQSVCPHTLTPKFRAFQIFINDFRLCLSEIKNYRLTLCPMSQTGKKVSLASLAFVRNGLACLHN